MVPCIRLLIAAAAAFAMQALAQEFPTRPVQVINGFTPGSSSDIVGRIVSAKLSEIWGQGVVFENRVGAGGTIASAAVARAQSDGYTLLISSSSFVGAPTTYVLPFDPLKDFTPLAALADGPNVLLVGTQTGWSKFGDFIAAAKAQPGKLLFSSAGIGSGVHFNLEKLKDAAKIDVVHVPYKGTPEAIRDTIAGRVCCYFAPINGALPHVKSGRAIALAISSAKRSPLLPEVPTIAESGVPGFEYTLWVGLWGPAGMPANLVERINQSVNKALESAEVRAQLQRLGSEPMLMSAAQYAAFVRSELKDTAHLAKIAGIKPQQ
ncbi:MAG: tripartite tricarboxylate transporter substrate binding protein [Rhodospirillales bacterium]|nr:tripartite tricarboxylate transporter substrate binding protein [Rhodospirillales bacterium]